MHAKMIIIITTIPNALKKPTKVSITVFLLVGGLVGVLGGRGECEGVCVGKISEVVVARGFEDLLRGTAEGDGLRVELRNGVDDETS